MMRIFIALILAFFASAFACGDKTPNKPPYDNGGPMPDNECAVYSSQIILDGYTRAPTPRGVKVQACFDPTAETRNAIDRGIQKSYDIATASPYNYVEWPLHNELAVGLFKRSRYCIAAAYLVYPVMDSQNLDGGEWDKDPRIGKVAFCAAGAFQLFENAPAVVLVDDPSMTETVAWFENEHAGLYKVDPVKFNQTALHFTGGGHPILPPAGEKVMRTESKGVATEYVLVK
jgi:hypothetical protein